MFKPLRLSILFTNYAYKKSLTRFSLILLFGLFQTNFAKNLFSI